MGFLLTILDFSAILLAVWITKEFFQRRSKHLPPGPRPLPLLGNMLDMPTFKPWETFWQWGQQYGESFELFIDVLKSSSDLSYQGTLSEFLFLDATSFSSIR